MMMSGINNQLLRMHRPWLARGYRDQRYAHSTKTCIDCAKLIVESTRIYGERGKALWFLVRHVVGAIIVLALHLFHIIDHPASSQQAEIEGLFVDLDDTSRWLSRMAEVGAPQNQPTTLAGIRIIANMRKAAEQRMSMISQGKRPRESIAAVVKRIANSVQSEEASEITTPSEVTSNSVNLSPSLQSLSQPQVAVPDDPLLFLSTGGDGVIGNDFMSDLFSADLGLFGTNGSGENIDWANLKF